MYLKPAALAASALGFAAVLTTPANAQGVQQPVLGSRDVPVLAIDGLRFRDMNRNGRLDRYEDWRLSPEQRADDLVQHMTLAEKAGTMMHGTLPGKGGIIGRGSSYDIERAGELIQGKAMNSFITRLSLPPRELAQQNNAVQALAEKSRLGIPVTISTDPRNHFQYVLGASNEATGFTQWPDTLGFGALADPETTRRFGDIARQEYRAVGIHEALSPQADLFSEPRWSRGTGTFGASPALISAQAGAYIAGFQGSDTGLTHDGVLTVVKHWVGYGAQPMGLDGHNHYGRRAQLDKGFDAHVAAFDGAFAVQVAGVMPTYPIPGDLMVDGKPAEQVGAGFSRLMLTDLLRGKKAYRGIVLSDWAITNDCTSGCLDPRTPQGFGDIAMPWGVETLPQDERFIKGVEAGLDQFGGVESPEILVKAVQAGRLHEARLAESARRVMIAKFQQGLFENPFVDEAAAVRVAATPQFHREAEAMQRRAQVLLQNKGALGLKGVKKLYVYGLPADAVRARGFTVVERPEQADAALIRMNAPFEMLHPNHFFGSRQHEGRLDFRDGDKEYEALKAASAKVPVLVGLYLDRPAILGNVIDKANVIVANFGASDAALLDVISGKARAEGRLPFELPSSMAAVAAQHPAIPDDSEGPLFPAGFGLGAN